MAISELILIGFCFGLLSFCAGWDLRGRVDSKVSYPQHVITHVTDTTITVAGPLHSRAVRAGDLIEILDHTTMHPKGRP